MASGRAPSISAFIAAALTEQRRFDEEADLLAELEAEGGVPTQEDRDWARRALGIQ